MRDIADGAINGDPDIKGLSPLRDLGADPGCTREGARMAWLEREVQALHQKLERSQGRPNPHIAKTQVLHTVGGIFKC